VVIVFWLRLDHLIKPCFCLLCLCSRFILRFLSLTSLHAHYESLHHSLPPASLACLHAPMCTIGARLPALPPLTAHFSSHALHLSISLRAPPVYLSYLLFLVLCVVAVPFRVECVCLRHSGLGAARPNILPHQQCC